MTKNKETKLIVNPSPHILVPETTKSIMWNVALSLLPATIAGVYFFGLNALGVVTAAIVGALLSEYLIQKFLLKVPVTINDGSAFVTGLLLALSLPSTLPFLIAFLGGVIAIAIAKQPYGGLGKNIFNPAMTSRVIMLISWPVLMSQFAKPSTSSDAITAATPLTALKTNMTDHKLIAELTADNVTLIGDLFRKMSLNFKDMFFGTNLLGTIGETSKLALLIGAAWLLYKQIIRLHGPLAMITTVFVGTWLYTGSLEYGLFHLLGGGVIIAAFFMITDYVTTPKTDKGRILFGIGCGLLTILIRFKGANPEGASFAILIMNALTPIIDKFCKPDRFDAPKFMKEEK
ncbi:MAG: RnfABCDGE type electron transport complex subunit D [Candidatus Riflebacteria bacterium]|nr:RnfABCDGE type electron transport complex subunit D [Candidatus Riflebacteria bacterium]